MKKFEALFDAKRVHRPVATRLNPLNGTTAMKFGARLLSELMRDGWQPHYINYKSLKKLISKMAKAELEGEIVESHTLYEDFVARIIQQLVGADVFFSKSVSELTQSLAATTPQLLTLLEADAGSFKLTRAGDVKVVVDVDDCEAASVTPPKSAAALKATSSTSAEAVNADVTDAIGKLAESETMLDELWRFAVVNLEAIRKIVRSAPRRPTTP